MHAITGRGHSPGNISLPNHGALAGIRTVAAAGTPHNRLLAALKPTDFRRIEPDLEPVRWKKGATLLEPSEPVRQIWFPETSVVSLVVPTESGDAAEVSCIGSDGVVGCEALLGDGRAVARHVVQVPGSALRLPIRSALAAMHSSEAFRQLMLKFSAALLAEAMQLSACHSLHASEARLACFLLLLQDRSSGALSLPLTQEILASMLSVQRTTITAVAGSMQKAGLISYRRGRLEILDHDGLAAVACECYGVIRAQYGRFLLHGRPPSA